MALEVFLGLLIRHALTAFGGSIGFHGFLTGDNVSTIVGGLIAIGGVALSVLEKKSRV